MTKTRAALCTRARGAFHGCSLAFSGHRRNSAEYLRAAFNAASHHPRKPVATTNFSDESDRLEGGFI